MATARTPTFNRPSAPLPPDVRLMNATAVVIALLAAVTIVAVALLWAVRQPVFALRSIRIEGDVTRNNLATLRANAAPRLAGSFFTIDLARSRRAFESVPWVRQAVVRRVFPDRLVVRLEEHRVAALWGGEAGSDKLVNTFGEVFQANPGDVEDDGLPTLQGPEGSAAQMLAMLDRLGPLLAPLEARIETLTLSGRGSWRAELDNGARIELGRGGDAELAERTARFVRTFTQVAQRYQRPLEYADLRHNGGYAVRLTGVSTMSVSGDKTPRN